MSGRSPIRMVVGIVMLALVYAWAYRAGAVQSFTAAIGADDPGKLSVPLLSDRPAVSDNEAVNEAMSELDGLRVAGRAPKTGYSRDQFGPAWTDVDGNGCDTRNDVLARDLTAETFTADGGTCVVATGTLADLYTGTTIVFTRGKTTSSAVQIDHVVALSDAWQKGAQALTATERTALANDPANLRAVDGPTNSAKGDGDAATWLPPNKAARCAYVSAQVDVKATYNLWVTAAERNAIAQVLEAC